MPNKRALADVEIARVAKEQYGVLTSRQLDAAGLGRAAVSERTRKGRLHRLHQGVYAVGHRALSIEARWMAAVLAYGEGAVLSHAGAAALWGLIRPLDGSVDVTLPSNSGRQKRAGVRVHRCASLGASGPEAHLYGDAEQMRLGPAVTVRNGIPVTAPWRTIEDLRRADSWLYRRARRQAELRGLALLPQDRGDGTRSDLEDDFLAFCRRHRIPRPEVNVRVGRWEVDFLWRARRVAVETDFFEYHRGSVAFEDDHARDLDLRRCGLAVRRYTGDQIAMEPERIAADLREALGRSGRA